MLEESLEKGECYLSKRTSIHCMSLRVPAVTRPARKWAKVAVDSRSLATATTRIANSDRLQCQNKSTKPPFTSGRSERLRSSGDEESDDHYENEEGDDNLRSAAVKVLYENGTYREGTLPVGENRVGRMCSCSDKIAAWNIVGVQGSLLATKLIEPIFIQSITIGRKFAYRHSARAFCCRVSKTFPSVNHPVLMQCERKFDLAPIDTNSVVVFDNPNSLIWSAGENEVIEVCNGKTGQREEEEEKYSSRYCSSARVVVLNVQDVTWWQYRGSNERVRSDGRYTTL